MTLLELLRQELPKRGGWPEGVNFIAQGNRENVWSFVNEMEKDEDDKWTENLRTGTHKLLGHLPEASDRATAIVTREQYESALAAENDGWIEWGGGECPVDNATKVDIKFRTGGIVSGVEAGEYYWPKTGHEYAIIAYRLRQPQESEQPETSEEDLNECIGQALSTAGSGRWLPSAGCECEYQYKVHGSEWCSFECVAVDGNAVFGWSNNTPTALQLNTHNFRPLCTEAERAIDEMVRLSGLSIGAAKILYDAGYRK